MSTSGDILEITFNHKVEGNFSVFCKSNESGTMERGGLRSNDDENGVTGAGTLIDQMNRVVASFESPPVDWDMTDTDALKKLSKLAASPILSDIVISSITGAVWGGRGKPAGSISGDTNTGLVTLKLKFENEIKNL